MDRLARLNFSGTRRLPLYRQAEAAECGHACLAMIASYHGHEIDIPALRRRMPPSGAGASLRTVMDMAARLSLRSRPLKVPLDMLERLTLPAILHWDLNHFVVLKAMTRKGAVLHDPARGERTVAMADLSDHYTGVALELTPEAGFEKRTEREKLRLSQLWGRITGLKRSLGQALVLSLIMQAAVLAGPFYLQTAVDHVVVNNDGDLLLALALGFGALAVFNSIAEFVRGHVLLYFGNMLSFQMVANLYGHMMRLPLPFFERRHIGDIVSRFGSTDPIRQLFTEGLVATLIDGMMALATLVLMLIYSPLLAAIAAAALALYLILRLATYRLFRKRSEDALVARAKESSVFMEAVRGMLSIKVFGREEERKRLWLNRFADRVNADVTVGRLTNAFTLGNGLIFGLENILLIYMAIRMILAGDFTVGMIFAFMAYKRQFSEKAAALVERLIEFRMLDLHLDRISDIALAEPEQDRHDRYDGDTAAPALKGEIRLENVSFSYGEGLPDVISCITLSVAAGQATAITGPSGGGKTTLIKLMMGLFQPREGTIRVDGRPLGEIGLGTYRQQTAAVMQEDSLFAGSLAENIAFFDGKVDMQRVTEAAATACILDDIRAMPMGFETLVGDMGSTFSGGQKQRILLARALYRRPRILFMDEGTAHLDVTLEKRVNAAIRSLGITRIIIAMADRVLVMDQFKLRA
ncbi:peptidase domain-containing ABC transporter [Yunchengibacter salinarum]|uniref:peptidase domain-containing ABC transporter n=1 Tax=Yunchengibacter salinarum TaxID=3133399 RepID=UPI0035B5FC0C